MCAHKVKKMNLPYNFALQEPIAYHFPEKNKNLTSTIRKNKIISISKFPNILKTNRRFEVNSKISLCYYGLSSGLTPFDEDMYLQSAQLIPTCFLHVYI